MVDSTKKTCFVISPIGEPGSETRERSDQILNYIIRPAVEGLGYETTRADEMERPGIITRQVITSVFEADLCIADLTERNPNVFYELAVRHVVRKPFIQLIQDDEEIPFDVYNTRTIQVNHHNLATADEARRQIAAQINSIEQNSEDVENPISVSVDLQRMRQSEVPEERSLAELLSAVTDVRSTLASLAELVVTNSSSRDFHAIEERLFSKMDELTVATRAIGTPRSRGGVNQRRIIAIANEIEGPPAFLTMLSIFRDEAPWIYEVGMEAYKQVVSDEFPAARATLRQLADLVESTAKYLPQPLSSIAVELPSRLSRFIPGLNLRARDVDDLPF